MGKIGLINQMLQAYYKDEFQTACAPFMKRAASAMIAELREAAKKHRRAWPDSDADEFIDAFARERGLE